MAVARGGLIAVAVGPVQVALGQVGGSSHLVGAACGAGISLGQIVVGILEIVDDVLHNFVVRALRG